MVIILSNKDDLLVYIRYYMNPFCLLKLETNLIISLQHSIGGKDRLNQFSPPMVRIFLI